MKILWTDKIGPVIQTKLNSAYFVRSTWPGLFLIHVSGNHKQNFPKLKWDNPWPTSHHLRKFQCYQFSVISIYGKSVSQSSCFVFSRANNWDFHFISFNFRLKLFHSAKKENIWDHLTNKFAIWYFSNMRGKEICINFES